ncbi:MAG: transposase, partial [Thaumarchaeota archaeon]|nr:transposase [Nitrososphaerota archaeon]
LPPSQCLWQRIWGKRILNTSIGGITCALSQKAQTLIEVPRFSPTTQKCSRCNAANKIEFGDRLYHCEQCGLLIDRDLNAAINIEKEGVPTVRREFTPADTLANTLKEYLNSIRTSEQAWWLKQEALNSVVDNNRRPPLFHSPHPDSRYDDLPNRLQTNLKLVQKRWKSVIAVSS